MLSVSDFNDRRMDPRFATHVTARLQARHAPEKVKLVNLSRRGGLIWAPKPNVLENSKEITLTTLRGGFQTHRARLVRRQGQYFGIRFRKSVDPQEFLSSSSALRSTVEKNPAYETSVPLAMAFSTLVYQFAKHYCRLEVTGRENIPYGSRFIWTHNHSGWLALDAVLIGHLISAYNKTEKFDWSYQRMGPMACLKRFAIEGDPGDWGITFWNDFVADLPVLSRLIQIMHGLPVSALKEPEKLSGYPIYATPAEGEEGNCKSSFTELYRLQAFRSGVARVAMECSLSYIAPAVIVGPEETFLNLGKVRSFKKAIGTILPVPAPVPPLPVKWVVKFLPPIEVSRFRKKYLSSSVDERRMICREIMGIVKDRIEIALREETSRRKKFRPWFI